MLGIPVGLAYTNAGEWLLHKHVLHGLGLDKRSIWHFHWSEHHRESRQRGFRDPHYERSVLGRHAQGKEALGLAALAAMHLPLTPIAPFFTGTVLYGIWRYYRVHKRAHLEPEWARRHVPWHYDHHMGPSQHANWCVTHPWFDHVMGTRVPYVGTHRERRDRARRAGRSTQRRSAPGQSQARG
jgi:sterol desaturase/sphingolipid hydroxylase (fatty acid hydroxylase superfamily)